MVSYYSTKSNTLVKRKQKDEKKWEVSKIMKSVVFYISYNRVSFADKQSISCFIREELC